MSKDCSLCKLFENNPVLYKEIECDTCKVPLVVYRCHTMYIPLNHLREMILYVFKKYGERVRVRLQAHSIRDHFHIHIYPEGSEEIGK